MAQIGALKMLNKHMDTQQRGVKHPITGEDLSVEESLMLGILDVPHNEYVHKGRQRRLSLPEAVAEDLVEAKVAKDVFGAMSKETLANLLESGRIDARTGKFIHPETGKKMSIKEAIEQGLLDPNTVFLIDPTTGQVTSLAALIEQGKFNPESGKIVDPNTGKEVSLNDAIAKKILNPSVEQAKVMSQASALKVLKKLMDCSQKGVMNPLTGEEVSLEEAVMMGIVDVANNEYIDPRNGESVPLTTAVVQGLIEPKIAKQMFGAIGKESLSELLEQNCADPKSGKYIDPETKEKMTMQAAIGKILRSPLLV